MMTPHTVLVIYIRATPSDIWRAITTREESQRFFWETSIERKVGGEFRLLNESGEAITAGEVLIWDPPHRLRLTWKELSDPDSRPGEVEYELTPAGDTTRLTVSNYDDPPPSAEHLDMGRNGWGFTLSSLKTLLETGAPLPPPTA